MARRDRLTSAVGRPEFLDEMYRRIMRESGIYGPEEMDILKSFLAAQMKGISVPPPIPISLQEAIGRRKELLERPFSHYAEGAGGMAPTAGGQEQLEFHRQAVKGMDLDQAALDKLQTEAAQLTEQARLGTITTAMQAMEKRAGLSEKEEVARSRIRDQLIQATQASRVGYAAPQPSILEKMLTSDAGITSLMNLLGGAAGGAGELLFGSPGEAGALGEGGPMASIKKFLGIGTPGSYDLGGLGGGLGYGGGYEAAPGMAGYGIDVGGYDRTMAPSYGMHGGYPDYSQYDFGYETPMEYGYGYNMPTYPDYSQYDFGGFTGYDIPGSYEYDPYQDYYSSYGYGY